MKCSILTIGDEILIGQVIDSNSAWLAECLNELGVEIAEILSVGDEREKILTGLEKLSAESRLILMTGGLGPTKDDITKLALIEFFEDQLAYQPKMYENIQSLFKKWGRSPTELHKHQCYLPSKAKLLENKLGTAPGMWFEKNGVIYVSLPGVPYEMKDIFSRQVTPKLLKRLGKSQRIVHRTILTAGEGETYLSEQFKDLQSQIPDYISLAFLPGLGQVRIRLSGFHPIRSQIESELDFWVKLISDRIGKPVYSYGKDTLEAALGRLCLEREMLLASAESCTGGHFAHRITSVPGSSKYFLGSIVSYSNEMKQQLLFVQEKTLVNQGAVSEATVIEMLNGLFNRTQAHLGIAISGIAGPDGGTKEKPVGTIWLAWGSRRKVKTRCLHLTKNRIQNILYTTNFGMNALRLFLMKEELP